MLNSDQRERPPTKYRNREQLVICVAAVVIVNALNAIAIAGGGGEEAGLVIGRVSFSAVFTTVGLRAGFSFLSMTKTGVHVSNTFSSFDIKWAEIDQFVIGRWKLLPYVCLIILKNGRTLHATGVQEARVGDGSAQDMVADLNTELARYHKGG